MCISFTKYVLHDLQLVECADEESWKHKVNVKLNGFSSARRVGAPNPHVVQGLTVHVNVHPEVKIRSEDK